jgi:pyrroline-5-carboxylate reductase
MFMQFSPGGTTERAIATFEEGGLSPLVARAMEAAARRAAELSEQLGN